MITAEDFLGPATDAGYTFWSGVPCSFLTPFINYVISSPSVDYLAAASEGEAVAVALGAHLAGRKTVVMCQNSGLGNTVNPLTSLNWPFRVPTILITTHRGEPGLGDEPQHELMGEITPALLDTLRIPWAWFPDDAEVVEKALADAAGYITETGRPFAFIMRKDTVAPYALEASEAPSRPPRGTASGAFERPPSERMPRLEAIRVIRDVLGERFAMVGTTGKIGRELFALGHRPNQLYVVGGMGCAPGIGLGIHEGGGGRHPVAVLDGDGALLMKMGTLATVGFYGPRGFLHLVLDNEAHESTGAQTTVSPTTDFADIALACGYRGAWRADSPEALEAAITEAAAAGGPSLVHVKIAVGSDPSLPRPDRTPEAVKAEFMEWLAS